MAETKKAEAPKTPGEHYAGLMEKMVESKASALAFARSTVGAPDPEQVKQIIAKGREIIDATYKDRDFRKLNPEAAATKLKANLKEGLQELNQEWEGKNKAIAERNSEKGFFSAKESTLYVFSKDALENGPLLKAMNDLITPKEHEKVAATFPATSQEERVADLSRNKALNDMLAKKGDIPVGGTMIQGKPKTASVAQGRE